MTLRPCALSDAMVAALLSARSMSYICALTLGSSVPVSCHCQLVAGCGCQWPPCGVGGIVPLSLAGVVPPSLGAVVPPSLAGVVVGSLDVPARSAGAAGGRSADG